MSGFEFDIEAPDLRGLLGSLKEFSPALARDLRRDLRSSGDDIIAEQRKLLTGNLPGPINKQGLELRWIRPKNGRKPYLAFRNTYETGDGSDGGVDNLRAKIRAGLKTRVTAGRVRSDVAVRSTGPRNGGSNMARVFQAKIFRHPVFGSRSWAYQQGIPYFWGPAYRGADQMREKVTGLLETAAARLAKDN
ncbi:hypothetical protein ACYX8G_19675 [Microbacterium saperdae]